ncbi:MAG: hypothetical protein ACM3O3_11015 [Syntrophothermus sp.]
MSNFFTQGIRGALLLITVAIIFPSCKTKDKPASGTSLTININNSTPERFIKDIWRYSLMKDTVYSQDTTSIYHKMYSKVFKESVGRTTMIKEDYTLLDVRIDSTKYVDKNNAIVYTSELDKNSEGYVKFGYVFSKENNKWLIDDFLKECTLCGGEGVYRELNTKGNTVCPSCKGKKLISIVRYRQKLQ